MLPERTNGDRRSTFGVGGHDSITSLARCVEPAHCFDRVQNRAHPQNSPLQSSIVDGLTRCSSACTTRRHGECSWFVECETHDQDD